jgi:hypothetical protein
MRDGFDDAPATSAQRTNQKVDLEHSAEQLGPGKPPRRGLDNAGALGIGERKVAGDVEQRELPRRCSGRLGRERGVPVSVAICELREVLER